MVCIYWCNSLICFYAAFVAGLLADKKSSRTGVAAHVWIVAQFGFRQGRGRAGCDRLEGLVSVRGEGTLWISRATLYQGIDTSRGTNHLQSGRGINPQISHYLRSPLLDARAVLSYMSTLSVAGITQR